jgi:Cu-processing system permease protein
MKIIKYVLLDLVRNKIILVYTLILAALSLSILNLDNNTSKGLLSLLDISLLFVPIISILFSTIYFFNSIEFTELLLALPLGRSRLLLSEYAGLAFALCMAYAVGIGLPVLILAPGVAGLILIVCGLLLTLSFSALALLVFVMFKDKTRGIGGSIIIALFFTLLFDFLLMLFIFAFSDYPIDKPIVAIIALNPVDLARVFMLLHLDVAVLMGYSGALFKKLLGTTAGSMFTVACMVLWIIGPLLLSVRLFRKKDL